MSISSIDVEKYKGSKPSSCQKKKKTLLFFCQAEATEELCVIGFHIMKVEPNRKYRLHRMQEKAFTSDYSKTKHIFLKEMYGTSHTTIFISKNL